MSLTASSARRRLSLVLYVQLMYASIACVSASMPVVAVVRGGRPTVSPGSRMAYSGMSLRSMSAYLWCVSLSVMTAAIVVSLPVPDVVGMATMGGTVLPTRMTPAISSQLFFGQATRAAAPFVASIGLPPPRATKPLQPVSVYCVRIFSTVFTEGLASTSLNTS